MAVDKATSDFWLEKGRKWLNAFDEFKIRQPIQLLIQQLDQARDQGDYTAAWAFIQRLQDLADEMQVLGSPQVPERSAARIQCAIAAYRMGNPQEAIRLFGVAREIYGTKYGGHHEATVRWMQGCVQWQAPHQENHAIASWDRSIEIYRRLGYQSREHVNNSRSAWYFDRVAEMSRALKLALKPSGPNPSPRASSSDPASSTPPVATQRGQSADRSKNATLRLLFLRDEIAAGGFSPIGIDPDLFGSVDIDQFKINDLAHRMISLRGMGHVIKLARDKSYGVVRVKGESMSAEGIDDGDYVLLRFQNRAENNDIVAAVVSDIETQATLKKYRKEGDKVILQFRSNSARYKEVDGYDKEYEFTQNDKGFRIVAVAIAVLKPV